MAKICDSFGANRYTYPAQFNQRTALLAEVQSLSGAREAVLAVGRHLGKRVTVKRTLRAGCARAASVATIISIGEHMGVHSGEHCK